MPRTTNYITRTFTRKVVTLSGGQKELSISTQDPQAARAMYAEINGIARNKVKCDIKEISEIRRMTIEDFIQHSEPVPEASKNGGKV